jgi:hypothetical protein
MKQTYFNLCYTYKLNYKKFFSIIMGYISFKDFAGAAPNIGQPLTTLFP